MHVSLRSSHSTAESGKFQILWHASKLQISRWPDKVKEKCNRTWNPYENCGNPTLPRCAPHYATGPHTSHGDHTHKGPAQMHPPGRVTQNGEIVHSHTLCRHFLHHLASIMCARVHPREGNSQTEGEGDRYRGSMAANGASRASINARTSTKGIQITRDCAMIQSSKSEIIVRLEKSISPFLLSWP